MFDFLKKKLNSVVSKIAEKVKGKEKVEREKKIKETREKKPSFAEKIIKKITEIEITEKTLDEVFEEMEIELLQADVAVEVIEKIKADMKKNLVGKNIKKSKLEQEIRESLRKTLYDAVNTPKIDLEEIVKNAKKNGKPALLVFLGFNGAGKTTTLAKVANWFLSKKYTCVFAAGDSFRAASIEQLEEHANKLKINIIKHQYGADPAAVIFDAVKHAQAKNIDVVLADTAGRAHTNKNLMDQLEKIVRVNKPDLKILVLDSMTGNDIINQCRMFDQSVGVDAIILTKNDVSNKGGSIISAAYVLKKPILFLGNGQEYKDLEEYRPEKIVNNLI
ncbi:MAG: signal recognition particle-docking protein FtsY [Candidatus Aenigmarchaeota archaeon]|nr:signal recognition particle-docking protein FtsY [Candidatus Aenigmarchaeota archaeon]MBU5689219.1 signal recognition particle-docking protein FtsY [Candidatus Aenigmarchaeota archaeon]